MPRKKGGASRVGEEAHQRGPAETQGRMAARNRREQEEIKHRAHGVGSCVAAPPNTKGQSCPQYHNVRRQHGSKLLLSSKDNR